MTVPKQQDLVDVVIADHREVEALFDELEASGDARNRGALVERVIAELVRHSVAEEQYLYPAVRDALPDGDEVADREIGEHAATERIMKQLERTDPADPAHADLVRSLIDDVHRHVQDQETGLLPKLRTACDDADLRELGLKFEQGKKIAPTRPHPAVPDNVVVGAGMGVIDRVRDAMTGRNKKDR